MRNFFLRSALVGTSFLFVALTPSNILAASDTAPQQDAVFRAPIPEIVNGRLVSVADQQSLGLVTIGSDTTCSGTLLNRYWVLTADHCVSSTGESGGPDASYSSTMIHADWASQWAKPTRYIRFWSKNYPLDIALMFLGAENLGPVNEQNLFSEQIAANTVVTMYEGGFSSWAFWQSDNPPTPVAAVFDERYRWAQSSVGDSSTFTYSLNPDNAAQPSGGDSGGPDIVSAIGKTGIVGVHCCGARLHHRQ